MKYYLFQISFLLILLIQLINSQQCVFDDCECNGDEVSCQKGSIHTTFPKRNQDIAPSMDDSVEYEIINIADQNIKHIPSDRLQFLEIGDLDLSNNKIETIDVNAFDNVVAIKSLVLTRNVIVDLDGEVFKSLSESLTNLEFNGNQLGLSKTNNFDTLFNHLKQLDTLNINSNELEKMPNLSPNMKLKQLTIKHNKIASLDSTTDIQLLPNSLEMLDFENNRLKQISTAWFSHLNNLKTLNLENNLITTIDESAFTHLTKLIRLNLAKNYLKFIPSLSLLTLENLGELNLGKQRADIIKLNDYSFDKPVHTVNQTIVYKEIDFSENKVGDLKSSKQIFCSRNNLHGNKIYYEKIKIEVELLNGLDNLCLFKQLLYSDAQLRSTNLDLLQKQGRPKCSCQITFLNTYFKLNDDKCETDKGTMISLDEYKCENFNENNFCSKEEEKEYECAKTAIEKDDTDITEGNNKDDVLTSKVTSNNEKYSIITSTLMKDKVQSSANAISFQLFLVFSSLLSLSIIRLY